MSWPLSRLRVVFVSVVFVSVLLPASEQRGQRKPWRRVRQQRKAALVARRFVRGVYACRGAGAHAGP